MKQFLGVSAFAFVLLLSGCGKDNPSKNSDGTCTTAYVDSVKAIQTASDAAVNSANAGDSAGAISNLESAQNACASFMSAHGDSDSCKLEENGVPTDFSTDRVRKACSAVSNALTNLRGGQTQPQGKPELPTPSVPAPTGPTLPSDPVPTVPQNPIPGTLSTIDDSTPIASLSPEQLHFQVRDAGGVGELIEENGTSFSIRGTVVDQSQLKDYAYVISGGAALCTIVTLDSAPQKMDVKKDQVLTSILILDQNAETGSNRVFAAYLNSTTQIACIKVNSTDKPFTLGEVRLSLATLLDVSVTKKN